MVMLLGEILPDRMFQKLSGSMGHIQWAASVPTNLDSMDGLALHRTPACPGEMLLPGRMFQKLSGSMGHIQWAASVPTNPVSMDGLALRRTPARPVSERVDPYQFL
jgi:hypothetical protein